MSRERWVVKAGSNLIHEGGPLLLRAWMRDVARLRRRGIEVIWITSGAIATGVERTGFRKAKRSLVEGQALSAIGQPLLMDTYNAALAATGLLGAQILLTASDIKGRATRTLLTQTLERLLTWKVVPVLNENDATANEEIRFGDNDALSALVAGMMRADRLVIMTDVAGLCDKDPKRFADAKILHHIPSVTNAILATASSAPGSSRSRGGMRSKLLAARTAQKKNIETWLVPGARGSVLLEIAERRPVGTRIGRKR